MKVVQRNKLQAIVSSFFTTNPNKDKSIRNRKMHQKLHLSVPLRMLFCFGDWSMEATALERKELLRCTLQDLFVSSPPQPPLLPLQIEMSRRTGTTDQVSGLGPYHRFQFANLRQRLRRRSSWQPALGAIPE